MKYLIGMSMALAASAAIAQDCGLCDDLVRILETHVAVEPSLPSAAMFVYSPTSSIARGAAVGTLAREGEEALTYEHPFRIASVTKPFVAATILKLHEQGRLQIQDSIDSYLSDDMGVLLASGGYDPKQITISHLLTHTSGLFDVFFTDAFQAYFARVSEGADQKLFTLEEQVRIAVEHGEPYGKPGERYHYSDTGYILLGAVIERLTNQNMAQAVREQLGFERLGLRNTWWEVFESPPADAFPRVHQYMGALDANTIQPTFDLYGGGGLISTTEDLAKFFYHLMRGEVFEREETLELMLAIPAATQADPASHDPPFAGVTSMYGHGVSTHSYQAVRVYAHSGFWGVMAGYSPGLDTSFAVSLHEQELAWPATLNVLQTVLAKAASQKKTQQGN